MAYQIIILLFEKGFPSMNTIASQFKKQTGLELEIRLERISILDEGIIELPKSISTLEEVDPDVKSYYFNTKSFKPLHFRIEEQCIHLEIGMHRSGYFSDAMHKTLYDLGGRMQQIGDENSKEWNPPKGWSRLKHWKEYSWYNRPRK